MQGLDISPLLITLLVMGILIFLGMFMYWTGIALLSMPMIFILLPISRR